MPSFVAEYIGVIHSPFTRLEDMPIQPVGAKDATGTVVVDEQYAPGLKDLDGFSHLHLLYHFHRADRVELTVVPYLDTTKRGVFATRSPLRPVHIGLSLVELTAIDGNRLSIRGVDVLDGTPLLDIKPFIPHFDNRPDARSGWMKAPRDKVERQRSDDRFA
ncbi:tRNA (N6-threonylcarbamoyladenosine(37)-N6)-methyltransferase TrmO [bacterium]|nr:tRNA (N6-threonylcarbamoyladenosine(37)-N6)-methyltransferase TrmO [bacterium]